MLLRVFDDKISLGKAAAIQATAAIRSAIAERGQARVVAASAASQFEFLEALTASPGIQWKEVELFHLDEYIGLPMTHPASFCKFLQERLIGKTGIVHSHLLDGSRDPKEVIRSVGEAISSAPIDIAFLGIGENGHIAFNDPPADFEIEEPYITVALDHACRMQQVGEGWFKDLDAVPTHAISMSVRQVLKAREILAVVPDARKASAIKLCFDGPISPMAPSSILRNHSNATVYLDRQSSALLSPATLSALTASA
ncbi:MAG TPA: 6-phosphogluconolactonase [Candidatus Acidoferrales bacterium]|jgi:glucosamine-6-phosphate deaminase|nr:6-phosphogluconolactonase [Candidatus Acidoferrales bacterium]